MKIIKNIVLMATMLIGSQYGFSQCDENVWNDSWTSCELSTSPNSLRGQSHWLLYEFDEPRAITDIHIWNANRSGESDLGVEEASIDYSIDGATWLELGDYTFPRANESDGYEGFDGPSLEGMTVRKVLFTFNTNFSTSNNPCMSIAEVQFNVGEESTADSPLVHIRKRNAPTFAVDGNIGGADGQNVYLWSADPENVNQQWLEIDRGQGYYTYQKNDTNFCLDSDAGGANKQNVYLNTCDENDQNQHWQKVEVDDGAFKLIKRSAPGFALDGGNRGADAQNVNLYNSANTSQNLHWFIAPVSTSSTALRAVVSTNEAFSILPNPVINEMSVTGVAGSEIEVFDLNGLSVLKRFDAEDAETLDMSELRAGIYVVEIRMGDEVISKKIIKE